MDWSTALQLVTASLASIGAGGAIVFAMSSWLGKVWASRILQKERSFLDAQLDKTRHELDVLKEVTLKFQNDKLLTYRLVVDVVSKLLATFDSREAGNLNSAETDARFDEFNERRIRVYGYLAMLAPQTVMDAQDRLMDHLLSISNNSIPYEWEKVRSLAIDLLNEVRADIGIDKSPISYNGDN